MKGKKIWLKALKPILEEYGLKVELEHRFHSERKWRVDMAVFSGNLKVAVEIEGGTYTDSRHRSSTGFLKDIEKYNQLTMNGFLLLRYTHTDHTNSEILEDLSKILEANGK
jgi:very-short-patch-repair endonuclease